MSIISFEFVLLVAILYVAYYTVLKNNQWLLLLCGSLVFYCVASPYYLIFLAFSVITAYFAGIYIDNEELSATRKKSILAITLVLNISILAVLKYTGFFLDSIANLASVFGINLSVPQVNFILPLGISFYTFMTISYLLDIYWGAVKAQRSFWKYALYISFFPHITCGPIDSYSDISEDLYSSHDFNITDLKEGAYLIVVGLFKKLVIASRLAVYVDAVYSKPASYGSLTLLFATLFYAFQMYCDFSGYVDIALGVSRLFGIKLTSNFDLPYLSKSVSEYWRRWHITLGVWFRTYIFYPVIRSSLCKKLGKNIKKKYSRNTASMVTTIVGLICVWFLTGLWHGASWHYVMHGLYHGTVIIISTVLAGAYKKWKKNLKISDDSKLFGVFQIVRTFVIVDISYILFRSDSLRDAWFIMKQIFFNMKINGAEIKAAILPFTDDNTAVAYGGVTFAALGMLILWDILKYNDSRLVKNSRYFATGVMVLMILLFGIFGQSSFLYAAY